MPTHARMLACTVALLTACIALAPLSAGMAQELVGDYGEPGTGQGQFRGARGMDIDGNGNVFIADRFRNQILRYDMDGNFAGESPSFFAGPPAINFDQVTDVAIAPGERLYAANEDDAQIVILDFNFNVIDTFGSQCVGPSVPGEGCTDPDGGGPLEVGDGQFNNVEGVAYDPNERIVVLDTGNDRVQIFDLVGNFLLKFGSEGDNEGEFQTPSGLDVDANGNVYVADSGNRRVQVFDADGNFLRSFGSACNLETNAGCVDPDDDGPLEVGDGQFSSPVAVMVDYAGNVYVSDAGANNRVQIFDANGDFRGKFSLPEDTADVTGLALDPMARVHVATGNPSGTPLGVPFVVGIVALDADGDSLPDLWEQAGIDTNLDGEVELDLTNLGNDYRGMPMVANPNRKDIFVEVDYFDCAEPGGDCAAGDTTSHRPRDNALDLVVQAFTDAPVMPGNGINLWVQVDEAVPYRQVCDFEDGCFDTVKAANFGTEQERAGIGVLAAKRLVFRYSLWVKDKEAGNTSSGEAEGEAGVVGNDFIVSLGSWTGGVGSRQEQAGTFMHELGHTLGLGHGGGDNTNCKPNYLSVMSYTSQVVGLQPTGQIDYSRTALPTAGTLVENNLDETIGIQDGAFVTFYGPTRDLDGIDQRGDGNFNDDWLLGAGSGAVDWDFDGDPSGNPAQARDITFLNIPGCGLDQDWMGAPDNTPTDTLAGFVDWDIIQIGFRDSDLFEDGQHGQPEVEIDRATAAFVREQIWRAQVTRVHEYSAKFICGIQDNPEELRLTPGVYATVVNIHNPHREPAMFRKKLALAFPPSEQRPGEIYPISTDRLEYDEALKVDCEDVRRNVFGGRFPTPYIDGFLVVQSGSSLDVVGVHTTAALGQGDQRPSHSDIEIERVPERITELKPRRLPDLTIDKAFDLSIDCRGSGRRQRCDIDLAFGVRNIGDAPAAPFNVQIVRRSDDSVLADVAVDETLAPGKLVNRSVDTQMTVIGQDPEARTLCIRADAPTDEVAEKLEDNNERCLSF